ncbi:Aste57867_17507 [Aphanomyces stellatus]|uniref:Aste57867_17507 protein n=1 Tax=Aphanomyces stellatus TaxID=120398 RepID=A0A485L858_9STRA|nr:hypothetical protein As57867_017447 [Aphanomyces stellatus]VFT94260.1 Aste57867_17507 [Aphanomyces stellatus]
MLGECHDCVSLKKACSLLVRITLGYVFAQFAKDRLPTMPSRHLLVLTWVLTLLPRLVQSQVLCSSSVVCTPADPPICGSNNVTYINICALELAHCKNKSIEAASTGICGFPGCPSNATKNNNNSTNADDCPKSIDVVCGTDGKSYASPCHLAMAHCTESSLELLAPGMCLHGSPDVCSQEFQFAVDTTTDGPLFCGSDGVTYPNRESFHFASCVDATLTLAHRGECICKPNSSLVCLTTVDPVCGSDDQTYGNPCAFQRMKCSRQNTTMSTTPLTLVTRGSCGPNTTNVRNRTTQVPKATMPVQSLASQCPPVWGLAMVLVSGLTMVA